LGNVVFTFISDHDVPLALIVIYSFSLCKIFRFKSCFISYVPFGVTFRLVDPLQPTVLAPLGTASFPQTSLLFIDFISIFLASCH